MKKIGVKTSADFDDSLTFHKEIGVMLKERCERLEAKLKLVEKALGRAQTHLHKTCPTTSHAAPCRDASRVLAELRKP